MKLAFLLQRAKPYRGRLLAIGALSLASSAALLAIPWLAGQLLGEVVASSGAAMGQITALLVLALTVSSVLGVVAALLSARTAGRVLADLRLEVYRHVQHLPLGFHERHRQGDLMALMTYEVSHLSEFLTSTLSSLPAMLLTAIGSIVLLFWIDPVVALFLPVVLPVFFVILKLVGRHLRELATQARSAEAALVMAAEEDLELLPAIKSFAVEQARREDYARLTEDAFDLTFRQARISGALGPAIALIAALAAISLLLLSGFGEDGTQKEPAEIFGLLLYAALLTRPIAALADLYGRLQWARGTLFRLEDVLAAPEEPGLGEGAQLATCAGAISFRKITFAYPEREVVLADLDLEIAAGETVALTGLNGAGKSTLINLLLCFYQPDRGAILLDGTDISSLQVQTLRRQFGFVPQKPLLFGGSLRENIVLGMPDASDEQIARACQLAQAEAFIASLPDGLNTMIGDRGVRLSGGQGQRIALARALLPDPPVLIFDEATAMFDKEGEEAFVAACQNALRGRTVLLVTHRPASLALADRIIEIAGGKARAV